MEHDDQNDQVRKLRHSLRGSINAMKLGITVLELGLPPVEAKEFLGYIEDACDSICKNLDDYDKLVVAEITSDSRLA